jgi:hypothetical protein
MRKFKTILLLVSAILLIGITQSNAASIAPVNSSKNEKLTAAIEKAKTTGKLSYKELKAIAEDAKGRKLNFRDKLVLKLFGKKITKALASYGDGNKSQVAAALLCAFLGDFGVHRFYLGYTWQGIVQILTLGGLGIWALIDFIRILTGSLQPKDGEYN